MYCPKCGYEIMCGCSTCKPKIPEGHLPEVWDSTGEFISCPKCNLTKHADWWEDLSVDIVIDKHGSLTKALKAQEVQKMAEAVAKGIDKANINNSFLEILNDTTPEADEKQNKKNFNRWLYGD